MIKKIFALTLFVSVCSILKINAQEGESKHEVSFGVGCLANSQILDLMTNLTGTTMTAGYVSYDNEKFSIPLSVEYFYHINPLVGVGGIAVYSHGKRDMLYDGELQGRMKTNYYTFIPAVKFNWLRKKNWGLYSKAGLGVSVRNQKWNWYDASHTNDSDTDFILNFQGTPIGVECGNQYYWGFLELGMGEQGIVNAGIRIKM
jgi:hypothetical protein